jgi:tRNA threonylcarbamoyl adenosine modification protein YeaZ
MKNFKILTIDTTDPEKTAILLASINCHPGLDPGSKILKQVQDDVRIIAKKTWRARTHQSEELLPAIDKLLKQSKIKTENLGLIIVCIGPGSFTGIRVGVATANAMAFGLDVPIIGIKAKNKSIVRITQEGFALFKKGKIKKGIIAKPFYDKAPNITTPKKK